MNYLGQDRSDIQHGTKELCAQMARPTVGGMKMVKRMGRYLLAAPRVVWIMEERDDEEDVAIEVYTDSDWAKGPERKSTSGGVIALGRTGVKHWSRVHGGKSLELR